MTSQDGALNASGAVESRSDKLTTVNSIVGILTGSIIAVVLGLALGYAAPYIIWFFKGLGLVFGEALRDIVPEGESTGILFCVVLAPILIPMVLCILAAVAFPAVFGLLVVGVCIGLGFAIWGAAAAEKYTNKGIAVFHSLLALVCVGYMGCLIAVRNDLLGNIYLEGSTGLLVLGWIGLVLGAIVCGICVFGISIATSTAEEPERKKITDLGSPSARDHNPRTVQSIPGQERDAFIRSAAKSTAKKIFFAPDIPDEKLEKATSRMAIPRGQEVLIFVDSTFRGSAKEGICITKEYIYWKDTFEKPGNVRINDIERFEINPKGFVINDQKVHSGLQCFTKDEIRPLTDFLADFLASSAAG